MVLLSILCHSTPVGRRASPIKVITKDIEVSVVYIHIIIETNQAIKEDDT